MASYWLGIDLGTTYTAAVICWPAVDGREVQVVPLSNHSHAIPSVLFLPGDGSLVVGEGAQRRALTDPDRVVREFKSRIGDEIPLLVGGSSYFAHDLAAEFVVWLWHYVVEREGERPDGVALTCPASWGPYKTGLFERAVHDAGLDNVTLLSEPQAAAISYASREQVEVGATLAVYDLGGGTFDAAVVRKDSPTSFTVLGRPEGIEGLGGVNFDEAIFEHVCAAAGVPLTRIDPYDSDLAVEVARLRRECTEAKEALSVDTDATIPVALGDVRQRVRVTRAELEEMIRPDLDRTIETMHRALDSAEVNAAELDAILLIGGSSRIPLVSQLIAAEFGVAPAIDTDPKIAVAEGAARFPVPVVTPAAGGAYADDADDDTMVNALQLAAAPPPARPEMSSMLSDAEQSLAEPVRPRSRKAALSVMVIVLVLIAGGVTALRVPKLADLLTHGTTNHATTAQGTATPAPSGSTASAGLTGATPHSTAGAKATSAASSPKPSAATSKPSKSSGKSSSKSKGSSTTAPAVTTSSPPSSPPVVRTRRSTPASPPVSPSPPPTSVGPTDPVTSPPATTPAAGFAAG